MLTWPDLIAYQDHSTTCCIRLFDPCIKYAQCICADGLIRLARKECFYCLSFTESYPYNRNRRFLLKTLHTMCIYFLNNISWSTIYSAWNIIPYTLSGIFMHRSPLMDFTLWSCFMTMYIGFKQHILQIIWQ